jgi:uncharacterized FAD-dependent dehydrogenase
MRQKIIQWGGEFHFQSTFSDLTIANGKIKSIQIDTTKSKEEYDTDLLVLAIGHSARDTFSVLYDNNIEMVPKSFAVGVRVEHKQKMIQDRREYRLIAAIKITLGQPKEEQCHKRIIKFCPDSHIVRR